MMTRFRLLVLACSLGLVGCAKQHQDYAGRWEEVPAGMVLTRNFMAPIGTEENGYQLLSPDYHLGSKAFGKRPPAWWLKLVDDFGIEEKWHPRDFPLVFARKFTSEAGTGVLLVVQASQAFSGDGYLSPGPEIYLVARLFAVGGGNSRLLREEAFDIGSLQYSRLLAGEGHGRDIIIQTEGGAHFDSGTVTNKRRWILSLGVDNSLRIKSDDLVYLSK